MYIVIQHTHTEQRKEYN